MTGILFDVNPCSLVKVDETRVLKVHAGVFPYVCSMYIYDLCWYGSRSTSQTAILSPTRAGSAGNRHVSFEIGYKRMLRVTRILHVLRYSTHKWQVTSVAFISSF